MTAASQSFIVLALGFLLCNAALIPELPTATSVETLVCPDKRTACPDSATCCAEDDGSYGCCPLKNAVCCSDKLHCCPSHTVCDLPHQTCTNASYTMPFSSAHTIEPDIVPIAKIITGHAPHGQLHPNGGLKFNGITVCSDYRTACPDHYTCCSTAGGFGCCPVANAVCCHDDDHCCPPATQCDLTASRCLGISSSSSYSGTENAQRLLLTSWASQELLVKQAGMPVDAAFGRELRDGQKCPDGQSTCATGSTCCPIPGLGFGCCPYPKADCCSDGIHCCPADYTCDVELQQCKKHP